MSARRTKSDSEKLTRLSWKASSWNSSTSNCTAISNVPAPLSQLQPKSSSVHNSHLGINTAGTPSGVSPPSSPDGRTSPRRMLGTALFPFSMSMKHTSAPLSSSNPSFNHPHADHSKSSPPRADGVEFAVNFKVVSAAQDEDDIEELPRDVYVLFDPRGLGFDLVGTYPVTAKHITPGSCADEAGLSENDIILEVDGTPVFDKSPPEVMALIKSGFSVKRTPAPFTPLDLDPSADAQQNQADIAEMVVKRHLSISRSDGPSGEQRLHRRQSKDTESILSFSSRGSEDSSIFVSDAPKLDSSSSSLPSIIIDTTSQSASVVRAEETPDQPITNSSQSPQSHIQSNPTAKSAPSDHGDDDDEDDDDQNEEEETPAQMFTFVSRPTQEPSATAQIAITSSSASMVQYDDENEDDTTPVLLPPRSSIRVIVAATPANIASVMAGSRKMKAGAPHVKFDDNVDYVPGRVIFIEDLEGEERAQALQALQLKIEADQPKPSKPLVRVPTKGPSAAPKDPLVSSAASLVASGAAPRRSLQRRSQSETPPSDDVAVPPAAKRTHELSSTNTISQPENTESLKVEVHTSASVYATLAATRDIPAPRPSVMTDEVVTRHQPLDLPKSAPTVEVAKPGVKLVDGSKSALLQSATNLITSGAVPRRSLQRRSVESSATSTSQTPISHAPSDTAVPDTPSSTGASIQPVPVPIVNSTSPSISGSTTPQRQTSATALQKPPSRQASSISISPATPSPKPPSRQASSISIAHPGPSSPKRLSTTDSTSSVVRSSAVSIGSPISTNTRLSSSTPSQSRAVSRAGSALALATTSGPLTPRRTSSAALATATPPLEHGRSSTSAKQQPRASSDSQYGFDESFESTASSTVLAKPAPVPKRSLSTSSLAPTFKKNSTSDLVQVQAVRAKFERASSNTTDSVTPQWIQDLNNKRKQRNQGDSVQPASSTSSKSTLRRESGSYGFASIDSDNTNSNTPRRAMSFSKPSVASPFSKESLAHATFEKFLAKSGASHFARRQSAAASLQTTILPFSRRPSAKEVTNSINEADEHFGFDESFDTGVPPSPSHSVDSSQPTNQIKSASPAQQSTPIATPTATPPSTPQRAAQAPASPATNATTTQPPNTASTTTTGTTNVSALSSLWSKPSTHSTTATVVAKVGVGKPKTSCARCSDIVAGTNDGIFAKVSLHAWCLKCSECAVGVSVGKARVVAGKLYCLQHSN